MSLKDLHPMFQDSNYRSYSTIILDIGQLRLDYSQRWLSFKERYLLNDDEFEALYDWCVLEALYRNRIRSLGGVIDHHYKHDIYNIVYEELAAEWQLFFSAAKAMSSLHIKPASCLKVLVAGYNLIIAQQGKFS